MLTIYLHYNIYGTFYTIYYIICTLLYISLALDIAKLYLNPSNMQISFGESPIVATSSGLTFNVFITCSILPLFDTLLGTIFKVYVPEKYISNTSLNSLLDKVLFWITLPNFQNIRLYFL